MKSKPIVKLSFWLPLRHLVMYALTFKKSYVEEVWHFLLKQKYFTYQSKIFSLVPAFIEKVHHFYWWYKKKLLFINVLLLAENGYVNWPDNVQEFFFQEQSILVCPSIIQFAFRPRKRFLAFIPYLKFMEESHCKCQIVNNKTTYLFSDYDQLVLLYGNWKSEKTVIPCQLSWKRSG